MDKVRQVLAQGVPPGVRRSYRTLADHGGVPRSTLHRRDHGGPSDKDKADSQLYLKLWEESALVKFILHMSDLGQPVRIKYIPALAFVATRARPPADRPLQPPGKNWPKAFEGRHPETAARRVTALDWNRHEKNIGPKMILWFEVTGRVLRDPAIRRENVYNMDEPGVMLSMLGSVKVLVGKDDKRKHRGAHVKRKIVTVEAATSASQTRRVRKRKSAVLEVEADSLNVGAKRFVAKRKVARVAGATGVPWIAPTAKMYRIRIVLDMSAAGIESLTVKRDTLINCWKSKLCYETTILCRPRSSFALARMP
jgi:hypothetical protein